MGPLDVPLMGGGRGASIDLDFLYRAFQVSGFRTSNLANVPGVSISRSSVGYAERNDGTLQLFQANEARITDKGLLVEEARTNLALSSQALGDANWVRTRASITSDATAAPDGTVTADKLVEDTTANTTHILTSSPAAISAGGTFTVSFYAKAAERTWITVAGDDGTLTDLFEAYFNLSAGSVGQSAVTGTGAVTTKTIQALANGWYRCVVTGTIGGTHTSARVRVFIAEADGDKLYTGNGSSGVYLWGGQFEAGASFATSYIPTTSAAATRAADNISVAGLSGLTAAYTLLGDAQAGGDSAGTFKRVVELSDGANSSNGIALQRSAALARAFAFASTVTQMSSTMAAWSNDSIGKIAGTFTGAAYKSAFNGGAVATGAGSTAPATISRLSLGSDGPASFAHLNGYLRRVIVYPRAFSDAELQAATQ